MKLFPSDWQGFLAQLVTWGELSIPARRAFLDGAAPGLSLLPAAGDPAVSELRDAGLLEESGGPGSLGISTRYVPFHQVVKSLSKYPLFESPGLAALCAYLGEHYTQQERSHLHESLALLPNDLPRIAGLVSSVEWLQTALARAGRPPQEPGWEAARAMLSFFAEQRDGSRCATWKNTFPPSTGMSSARHRGWACSARYSFSGSAARTSSPCWASGPRRRAGCAGSPSCWPLSR